MAVLELGREITGDPAAAGSRERLCTDGLGGFASGAVAGLLTRRHHGLLVAAEIVDRDAPFSPRGCPARAWSEAEVRRAFAETT